MIRFLHCVIGSVNILERVPLIENSYMFRYIAGLSSMHFYGFASSIAQQLSFCLPHRAHSRPISHKRLNKNFHSVRCSERKFNSFHSGENFYARHRSNFHEKQLQFPEFREYSAKNWRNAIFLISDFFSNLFLRVNYARLANGKWKQVFACFLLNLSTTRRIPSCIRNS